jgi:hypothetical protein
MDHMSWITHCRRIDFGLAVAMVLTEHLGRRKTRQYLLCCHLDLPLLTPFTIFRFVGTLRSMFIRSRLRP